MGRREWSFQAAHEGASWVWGRLSGEQSVFHPERHGKPGGPEAVVPWQERAACNEFRHEQPLFHQGAIRSGS